MPQNPTDNNDILSRFMKVYSNLPIKEREQVVVVIDGEPVTWSLAYNAIQHNPDLGKKIGSKLIELDII